MPSFCFVLVTPPASVSFALVMAEIELVLSEDDKAIPESLQTRDGIESTETGRITRVQPHESGRLPLANRLWAVSLAGQARAI